MKAQIDSHSHSNSTSVLGLKGDGKITKKHHKEEENEEIKVYLNKLQELVPFMPKNRKLSKLEVITYVIDYIRDLRQTLGLPPNSTRIPFDLDEMINSTTSAVHPSTSAASQVILSRQPLGVISSQNTSLSCAASSEIPPLMDKSPSAEVDTRPVSC